MHAYSSNLGARKLGAQPSDFIALVQQFLLSGFKLYGEGLYLGLRSDQNKRPTKTPRSFNPTAWLH